LSLITLYCGDKPNLNKPEHATNFKKSGFRTFFNHPADEHPADSTEHPADSSDNANEHPEHPKDSTKN
jgi:hypothetical protein